VREGVRARQAEWRRAGVGLGVLALLALGMPARADGAEGIDYAGHVVGDPLATVSLHVRTNKGGDPRNTDFDATNVQLCCEDGTIAPGSVGPYLRIRFHNQHSFDHEFTDASFAGSSFAEVKVRLLSRGRAGGYLVYVGNAYNPPPAGVTPHPDCSTQGRIYWKAERVAP
jgi:hypothetical protein